MTVSMKALEFYSSDNEESPITYARKMKFQY